MGCGASSNRGDVLVENVEGPQAKKQKKKHTSAVEGLEDTAIANADAFATATAVAGTAALVAGAVSADARHAMGDVASAAGSALLAVGKELPWVAPIAFLIGGVVQAASEVHALKGDAQAFARNVQGVEKILHQAGSNGTLDSAKEACEALKEVMEEGLAHCHRLQTQYFITSLVLSGRDTRKFEELNELLQRELNIVAAAASVSVASFHMQEMKQGMELRAKIDALGGPDAVANDPQAKAQIRGMLKESDQVVVAAIDAVALDAAASRKQLQVLTEENREQRKVMEMQVDKLTNMMQALLKFRAGIEEKKVEGKDGNIETNDYYDDSAPPPSAEELAEKEAAMSAAGVKDVMRRMPLPNHEVSRLEAVADAGMDGDEANDLVGNDELQALVDEARETFGATDGYIGGLDHESQTLFAHTSQLDGEKKESIVGLRVAKEVTACKHVVAKDDFIQTNGDFTDQSDGMPELPNLNMGEIGFLAGNGLHPGMGAMMEVMGAAMDPTTADDHVIETPTGSNITVGGMRNFMQSLNAKTAHYTGVPIRVNGQIVATFCVLDREKHRNDIDVNKVKALADKAAKIFVKRAEARNKGKSASAGKKVAAAPAAPAGRGGGGGGGGGGELHDQKEDPMARLSSSSFTAAPAAEDGAAAVVAADAAAGRGEVVELTSSNFVDVALDPNVDVAVLLVTPWCQHCVETKKAWAEAARAHASAGGGGGGGAGSGQFGVAVMFATYDAQQDDPPVPNSEHAAVWQTTAVPALVLAPRGGGEGEGSAAAPLAYGNLTAADVPAALRWLASKGVPVKASTGAPTSDSATSVNGGGGNNNSSSNNNNSLVVVGNGGGVKGGGVDALTRRSIGGGGGGGFDSELFQLALTGLRQAETSGVQVMAAWAATADSPSAGSGTADEYLSYMSGMMKAQSNAAEEGIVLATNHSHPHALAAAVKNQQECHAQQTQFLRTLAGAVVASNSTNGGGGEKTEGGQLRKHSEALIKISKEASERHLTSAMTNLRLAYGET